MRDRLIGPPSEPQGHSLGCLVNGCPLPGTWSNSTLGGPKICFVHDGADAVKWAAITNEIHRHRQVFALYAKSARETPNTGLAETTLEALKTRGYEEVAALYDGKEVNSARKFAYVLRPWLRKKCGSAKEVA